VIAHAKNAGSILVVVIVAAFIALWYLWPQTSYPVEVRDGQCVGWEVREWAGGLLTQVKDGPFRVPADAC
jgi:hypothetical protein